MTLYIEWFGKFEDYKTNYEEEHHGNIHGTNAADCMRQFREFKRSHDLAKYTIPQIVNIED